VDVEASAVNKTAEVEATKTMIDRVEEKFAIKPCRLVGDTNCGVAAMLGWLVNKNSIVPHVPAWDKSEHHDGTFSRADFIFDAENNCDVCPAGKHLKPAQRSQQKNPFRYRASQYDCQICELKTKCCPNMVIRKIDRSPQEPARDLARVIGKTDAYRQSRRERKKVEMLFAHLKRILKLGQLRLRGPSGAHDEFLLAATAQNLRRMAKSCLYQVQNMKTESGKIF
ncbi:transposase, partial [Pseudoduganella dura]|uniref:transposase n=1 Tax=Pseudoduganella dura TaxID=321982 RepID=UPI001672BA44